MEKVDKKLCDLKIIENSVRGACPRTAQISRGCDNRLDCFWIETRTIDLFAREGGVFREKFFLKMINHYVVIKTPTKLILDSGSRELSPF